MRNAKVTDTIFEAGARGQSPSFCLNIFSQETQRWVTEHHKLKSEE